MKFKKTIAWLLAFILCMSLTACTNKNTTNYSQTPNSSTENTDTSSNNDQSQGNQPLLYKVTDDNGNVLWLFGSIHIGREEYYPLPDYVLNAFDSADTLAVEADIVAYEKNYIQQSKDLQLFMYADGSKIYDHISEKLYNDAVNVLKEYDSYLPQYNYFNASFWCSIIENIIFEELGANYDLGIDRHLINRANDKNKEIYEIESCEFQYSMLSNYSEELQIFLLEEIVEMSRDLDTVESGIEMMLDLWASGNEKEFAEYLIEDTSEFSEHELALYKEYNDAMIVNRNINMTNYAETALKSGKEVFICVGSAHVIGDGAIADLMQERGYTVELIKK